MQDRKKSDPMLIFLSAWKPAFMFYSVMLYLELRYVLFILSFTFRLIFIYYTVPHFRKNQEATKGITVNFIIMEQFAISLENHEKLKSG